MRVRVIGLALAFGLTALAGAQAQSADEQAGYDWAEANGVTDPSSCGGESRAFVEGCQAYAEEQSDAAPPDDEAGPGDTFDPEPDTPPGDQLYEDPQSGMDEDSEAGD